MKKATLILMLSLASLCIQAQETRPVQTVVCQDEQFLLDTSYNEREDRMNFEFHASDSIVLDPGFSRKSLLSSTYYTMDLTVDVLGVYPPGHGLQGGPDEADTGYVGAIGGTVDVSAMGGATYTIPLELPAGINGMQPSLALVYNSQGGNGLLGWKWDLAGLSSITRTGKTRYHDGAVGGVTLNDQTDRFMLDGQRLIQVHDYGDSVDYKTEQDGMARIRAYLTRTTYNLNGHVVVTGHIDNFKVWNPDGTVCEYGFTEDSRIDPQNGKVYALCWLLNKVSDRNGNAIVYHYEELQQSGQFYISSIEYTGNESLFIKPEFIVCFGYTDKSDYEFGYVAGNIVQQKRLLSSVTLKKTSGKTLSNYSFRYTKTADYANSGYCSNRMYHRLTGVTLEKGGMTMNPTQIVWEYDESSTHHDGQVFDLDTTYFNNFTFVGDFNADGFSDVLTVPYKTGSVYPGSVDMNVLINQGDGTFEYNADLSMNTDKGHPIDASLDWVHIIDLNDDGYDDVIMQYFTQHQITQETNLMVYMNQRGERFVPAWESPLHMGIKLYLVYGDFFGEGKQSALVFTYAMLNDVQNNIVPVWEPYYYIHCDNEVCSFDRVTADPMTTNDVTVGDFNGDGRTEILMVHRNEAWMYDLRHNGGGFLFHTIRRCPEIRYVPELNLFPGDYNGDGKEDLLCYGKISESSVARSWFFLFSTGNSFNIEPTAIFLSINLSPSEKLFTYSLEKVNENNTFAMFASDFDGDGLCDVAVSRNEGNHSSVVVYSKFVSSTFMYYYGNHNHLAGGHNPLSCASVYGFKARSQYIHVGNFFGKDNMSFLATEITTHNNVIQRRPKLCTLYSLHEFNSVTRIIDGLGNEQRLSYKYPTVCGMPRTDMGNGIVKLNVPIRTLKATRTYRVDAPFTTSYNFENAVYHKDGHGYLGFLRQESVCMINNQDVSKHISEFETATMGAYAFSLPKEDNTYVYLDGSWKNSAKSEYSFRNIVSSLNPLVVKPAMTNQCTIRFNIDNPSVPNECLRKEITEYDYSFATDGTYSDAYNCTETRVGVSGQNIGNYSQCEFKTEESIHFYPDNYDTWTINRPHNKAIIRKRTDKPDVNHCWWYEYTATNSYLPRRIYDIPWLNNNQDPLMTQTDYEYYPEGNLKKQTLIAPHGTQGEPAKTVEYEYGPESQHRLVVKETASSDGLRYETQYTYDDYDRKATRTGSNGLVTIYENDALGIYSKTINPDGTQTASALRWVDEDDAFAPNDAMYLKWGRNSGCNKTLTYYHKSGAELRSVSFGLNGEAIFTDRVYDDRGRLMKETSPFMEGDVLHWTEYRYDNLDRPTATLTPDETVSSTTYLGLQTRTTVTPTTGVAQVSTITANAMGWTIRSDDASGNSFVTYDHYADGLLATATVNDNPATTITATYDNARNRQTLTDPNYGTLTTTYNAYGEMRKRVSPKELEAGQETSFKYDGMGRLVRQIDGMGNTATCYIYDEEEGSRKGTLKELRHRSTNGQDIQCLYYEYDGLARPTRTLEQRPSSTYETLTAYDEYSRVSQTVYPTGVTVNYKYSHGYLQSIFDAENNLLWRTDKANAFGQLVDASLGNGSVTHRAYKEDMHYIDSIVTTNNLQNLSYGYDKFGNLASRKDNLRNLEETFLYDNMNRLTDIYLGNTHSQIVYDPLGRMTDKEADGQTVFANADFTAAPGQPTRPHAMTGAETTEYAFPAATQSIGYTSFDKVKAIVEDGNYILYTYGYDQQRIHLTESVDGVMRLKEYVGVCEFITDDFANTPSPRSLTYLVGPYGVFAAVEKRGSAETVHYILKDHLGSWTTITDADGVVEQELSFDAWGKLRDPVTWSGGFSGTPMFDRGFTGHEHISAFGLVNMNGRCYDPVTSHFLSVDAYVQDPTSAQAFNRYAYCAYNPLRYTDPTGWLCGNPNPIRQSNGANYNAETTWQSDDINDVLWGRSVHPCETGNPYWTNSTFTTYTQGNEGVTGINKFYHANGKYLGTDGKYEGKTYIVFNVRSDIDETGEQVLYNISSRDVIAFIKNNNGNVDAFTDDCIAYANSFEIPCLEYRIKMVENVSADTGKSKDALKPSNNREYGGKVGDDKIYESDVRSPKYNSEVQITLPGECSTYHSHPSGFVYEEIGGNIGGYSHTYSFQQHPSTYDINHCGNYNCFVIGRGSGYVYGYNSSGTHIQVKTSYFINPKIYRP